MERSLLAFSVCMSCLLPTLGALNRPTHHCLVISYTNTTPFAPLYTSRNSASRVISEELWGWKECSAKFCCWRFWFMFQRTWLCILSLKSLRVFWLSFFCTRPRRKEREEGEEVRKRGRRKRRVIQYSHELKYILNVYTHVKQCYCLAYTYTSTTVICTHK